MKYLIIDNYNIMLLGVGKNSQIIFSENLTAELNINKILQEYKIKKLKIILKDYNCIYKIVTIPKFSRAVTEKVVDNLIEEELKLTLENYYYSYRKLKIKSLEKDNKKSEEKIKLLLAATEKKIIDNVISCAKISKILLIDTFENIISQKFEDVYQGDYFVFYSNEDYGCLFRYIGGKLESIHKMKKDLNGSFVKAFNDVIIFYEYQKKIDYFIFYNEENLWIIDYFYNLNIEILNYPFLKLDYLKLLSNKDKIFV